jgi:hypothetical protein
VEYLSFDRWVDGAASMDSRSAWSLIALTCGEGTEQPLRSDGCVSNDRDRFGDLCGSRGYQAI